MISTTSPATTRTKTTPPTVMAGLPRYLSIRGSPDRESRRDSRHRRTRRRRRRAPSALARTEHDADGTARGHEGQRPEPPGRHGHHGRKGQKTGDEVRHRLGQHLEQGDPDHPDHRGADPPERSVHPRDPPDALEHGHDGEHQHERGQEDRGTTHDRPPETADSITHECREHHDWPRRELTECRPSKNSRGDSHCSWLTTWSWTKARIARPPPKVKAPTLKKTWPASSRSTTPCSRSAARARRLPDKLRLDHGTRAQGVPDQKERPPCPSRPATSSAPPWTSTPPGRGSSTRSTTASTCPCSSRCRAGSPWRASSGRS